MEIVVFTMISFGVVGVDPEPNTNAPPSFNRSSSDSVVGMAPPTTEVVVRLRAFFLLIDDSS
jgi:hypothetical protein